MTEPKLPSTGLGSRLRRALALALVLTVVVAGLALARRARLERADFAFVNGGEPSTLDPAAVSGQADGRVAAALFEGLTVRHPQTLEPLPGVAESWDVDRDGLGLTFHLRAARWSNGEALTAEDFVWSWKRLLDPASAAPYGYLLHCVRGARAFAAPGLEPSAREALWPAVAIRALDARTLRVELERPAPYFLGLTGFHPLFPVNRASLERVRERFPERWQTLWLTPRFLVSNGPYRLRERRVNDRLRLVKNDEYWDADSVAFRTVDVLASEQVGTVLNLYLAGEVDWIDRVPTSLVPVLRGREDFRPAPYLATYFYRVNTTRPPFDDARVRRALALAIDRRAIVEKILKKGELPSWSLTPPGFAGYRRAELAHAPMSADLSDWSSAFAADCAEARALLAAAGLGPGTRRAPVALHFNTSETHRDIAEVIAQGWAQELGLEVHLANQEWKAYLDTQNRLAYDVSRSSWIGDYADPGNFLEVFASGGENNRTGWSQARYDGLLAAAGRELDPAARLALLAEAEELLLAELPILPIYSYVSQNLVNPRLGGFHPNLQDEHPLKTLYWKSDEELAAERAALGAGVERVPAPGPRLGLRAPLQDAGAGGG